VVAAGLAHREQVGGAVVDLELVQVDEVEAVALGERAGELAGVDDPSLDQGLAERDPPAAALLDGALDELALGEAELHDHIADAALRSRALRGRREPGRPRLTRRGGLRLGHASHIGSRGRRYEP
jgi:hypothetical protein